MYFPDLGPGWAPAFLETFQEIDLIREAQNKHFNSENLQKYFIAGTVDMNDRDLSDVTNHCNAAASGIWHIQIIY